MDILNHASGVPKQIILRSHNITSENVDEYVESLNKPLIQSDHIIDVGYSQLGTESAWRLANTASIKEAAKDAGINLIYEDADQVQEKQVEAIRKFIDMKVDVIVLSPVVDYGWEEVLKEAKQAGIPVLLSDRKISVEEDDLFKTYIGAEFLEEGRSAMRWIAENVPADEDGVSILELQGTIGASPSTERKKGFEEILSQNPAYKIVYSESGYFTYKDGKRIVTDYLSKHAWDIDVIYAHNDDMALGAISALEGYGLKPGEDVKIVSIDGTKEAFKAVIDGDLNCTVECNPLLGPQLMKAIQDLTSGKELPLRIITEGKIYTKEEAEKALKSRKY
jgi:simple sugar transport system substrate-binding protein